MEPESAQRIVDRAQWFNISGLNNRERRVVINSFLAQLTPWELLSVRRQLSRVSVNLSRLEDLPIEIVCYIVEELRLQDVLNCRLASKKWCKIWSQDAVLGAHCRLLFPGLIECNPALDIKSLYLKTAKNRIPWAKPLRRPVELIPWNSNWSSHAFDNEELARSPVKLESIPNTFPCFYADGKLAWQPGFGLVLVDDLYTRKRQRFSLGPGPMSAARLQIEGVSKKLLVMAGTGRDNTLFNVLYVRHLEHGSWKKITLPGPFAKCYMDQERIGAVTTTGQVLIWQWDGSLKQLDVAGSQFRTRGHLDERLFGGVPGVLFHPTQPNVIYCVWATAENWRSIQTQAFALAVVKFVDGTAVWRSEKHMPNPIPRKSPTCLFDGALGISFLCKKANNHGSFVLSLSHLLPWSIVYCTTDCECHQSPPRFSQWDAVTFDVFTETFSEHSFDNGVEMDWDEIEAPPEDGPRDNNRIPVHAVSFWNGSLIITQHVVVQRSGQLQASQVMSVESVRPFTGAENPVHALRPWCYIREDLKYSDTLWNETDWGQNFVDDDFIIAMTPDRMVIWTPTSTETSTWDQEQKIHPAEGQFGTTSPTMHWDSMTRIRMNWDDPEA